MDDDFDWIQKNGDLWLMYQDGKPYRVSPSYGQRALRRRRHRRHRGRNWDYFLPAATFGLLSALPLAYAFSGGGYYPRPYPYYYQPYPYYYY